MIKELRERTAAGMLDCKKALEEAAGDIEQAIDILRTKGLAAAAKKQGRISSEGLVVHYMSEDRKLGTLFEINCETDFVAKNVDFKKLCSDMVKHVAQFNPTGIEDGDKPLVEQNLLGSGAKIKEVIMNSTATIGEKLSPRRFVRWETEGFNVIDVYIHGPGKIGIMVELTCGKEASRLNGAVIDFAHKCAMQVAAAKPEAVKRDEISADLIARERDVYVEQVKESGKPEAIWEKIILGKIEKFYKDASLLEQQWVHDTEKTVSQILVELSKAAGDQIGVKRFVRWELGEGLQKRVHDIAAEVAEQLNK